jgi:integrase
MRDLNYQLKQLCERNRDGSYSTQANRTRLLSQMADQLYTLGYRGMQAQSLKPKHVEALVQHWQAAGLAVGTLKNRLAALRWWAEKIGKPNIIARDNAHYGIPERQYVTNVSKAQTIGAAALAKVADPHVRLSLELQREFGLRREEAIKFQPAYADRGDQLVLKPSWTKGGKAREVPVRTAAQRAVLDQAQQLAGRGSLIPPDRTYIQQLRLYERHTANAGLSKLHGLRHAYAQRRYEELTGWQAPATGGPTSKALTPEQKALDREARLMISQELGHEREPITAVYLGR